MIPQMEAKIACVISLLPRDVATIDPLTSLELIKLGLPPEVLCLLPSLFSQRALEGPSPARADDLPWGLGLLSAGPSWCTSPRLCREPRVSLQC